ncbi:hypothetical protein [Streptococcus parasanguinis]|uniref:hypothetical protein n=1 Tax=Streptococcus parasanguinis TaxID=1318 RepID=UPI00356712A3
MNQKDWVEYFEAINGRKPSMQEFQEAREKGEFVVERKEAPTPTTEAPAPATEAQAPVQEAPVAPSAPLSQEQTSFVQPQPSAKTLQPVPRPKLTFNKPTKLGVAVVAAVTVIALVWIFFFTGGPSVDGVWLRDTDSSPVTYELSGKKQRVNGDETIKKVLKGNEAKKEFNTALSLLNAADLHSLADVDKKFNLKTTEIVVIKSGGNTRYNLLQKDGSNIILRNDLFDLKTYKSYKGNFEDNLVYHKVETPKAMVGKWKNVTEGSNTTVQISDHGIISDKYYDSKAYAFYSLADSEKYDGDTTSKEEIEHTFEVIQEAVKSEGYQVKSAKEVYIQANSNYCFVPVNGGKNILVLRGGNEFAAKLEKVK